jgi:hypothetical protein
MSEGEVFSVSSGNEHKTAPSFSKEFFISSSGVPSNVMAIPSKGFWGFLVVDVVIYSGISGS